MKFLLLLSFLVSISLKLKEVAWKNKSKLSEKILDYSVFSFFLSGYFSYKPVILNSNL